MVFLGESVYESLKDYFGDKKSDPKTALNVFTTKEHQLVCLILLRIIT